MIVVGYEIKNHNNIMIFNRKDKLKLMNDKCKFHHRNIMLVVEDLLNKW